ncbi:MAG: protein phosphatase 2C domain-containing protein [Myxococcota bacterium]
MQVRYAGATKTGLHRKRNEDTFTIAPEQHVVVLADGIGGRPDGDVASEVAAQTIVGHILRADPDVQAEGPRRTPSRIEALLVGGVREAHDRIKNASVAGWGQGMGTTVVTAICDADAAWVAHVGDSRAYLIRDGELQRLTEDHTLLAELRRRDVISDMVGEDSPMAHQLTRALGIQDDLEIDVVRHVPRPGDVLLLCSDGLPHAVSPERIVELVTTGGEDLLCAAQALVAAAIAAEEPDDTTVVLVAWDSDDEAETLEVPAARFN